MNNNICAIVISYGNIEDCKNTIAAIHHQVDHIVVVNNFSTSNLSEELILLYSQDSKISLIFLDKNYGIAYALNRGVELALSKEYQWIITMDQDSISAPNMISEMFLCIINNSYPDPILCIFSSYKKEKNEKLHCKEIYMGITSGNLIHSRIYKDFGLYNEDFFIDSVDFEFFLRIKNHGIKFYQALNATMTHSLGTKKDTLLSNNFISVPYTHSPLRRYYMVRNHLYLCKHFFFKNPIYLSWKTLNIFKLIISIIFFENGHRIKNIKMIMLAVQHFLTKKSGKLQYGS